MRKLFLFLLLFSVIIFWTACFNKQEQSPVEQVLAQYKADLESLQKETELLVRATESEVNSKAIQDAFVRARHAYKQIEWLAEYYQPYTARFVNGPALEEVEPDDKTITIQPEGFQVIEELIYPEVLPDAKAELILQTKTLQSNIGRLQATAETLNTTDAHIFDALRLQVFRMISLGISGFDAPIAHTSIAEAEASLKGLHTYFSFYRPVLKEKNQALCVQMDTLFSQTKKHLLANTDFDSFDRMQFIRKFANPLSEQLLAAQKTIGLSIFKEPRALRGDAPHLFAPDVFNADFFAPGADAYTTSAKVALGKQLFFDPILSAKGNRSCGSCHQPGNAFTDALKTNTALTNGTPLKRNTPSLLNAALQPALFYDTRVASLEDQAESVILNKEEMHGSLKRAAQKMQVHTAYSQMFSAAYPGMPISEQAIKNALAAYVRSLVALNSRFDQYMRGAEEAMNQKEIEGFNLFMGKAKCGTCHFAPLFNGSNPPNFTKIDAEVIGVPANPDSLHAVMDTDEGKYYAYGISLYRHAFKTPTVRNSALTAPYMHNGVFNTLEEVMAFYNRGGGKGLGLPVDNQTLPEDKLHLSDSEQQAIVAFMHSLNDTTTAVWKNENTQPAKPVSH